MAKEVFMKDPIIALYEARPDQYDSADRALFEGFIRSLNEGRIRACDHTAEGWRVNQWIKMGILIGFRMGMLTEASICGETAFFEKDTFPVKELSLEDRVRIVPGGTSLRTGCYVAPGVTVMPPSFINVGAYIDSGSMIDSHALVGSCAQIGKNVHLSAGAMIGGVLEPIGSRPVIIEDDVFIGGNTGLYEGILVQQGAVLATGTIITASTPVFDSVHGEFLQRDPGGSFTIPQGAVVVPGSRELKNHSGFQVYCPIIIKYRDGKTDSAVQLEQDLRDAVE
jgi:2,3,4,5-tetrahydropyridine-2,6-dicarboxylate N-succinyltransferase